MQSLVKLLNVRKKEKHEMSLSKKVNQRVRYNFYTVLMSRPASHWRRLAVVRSASCGSLSRLPGQARSWCPWFSLSRRIIEKRDIVPRFHDANDTDISIKTFIYTSI